MSVGWEMQGYWRWPTRWGEFRIVPTGGRFLAMVGDESLGSYHSAIAAHDDLVGGHTFTPSSGVDTSTCGLPSDLADWEFVRAR